MRGRDITGEAAAKLELNDNGGSKDEKVGFVIGIKETSGIENAIGDWIREDESDADVWSGTDRGVTNVGVGVSCVIGVKEIDGESKDEAIIGVGATSGVEETSAIEKEVITDLNDGVGLEVITCVEPIELESETTTVLRRISEATEAVSIELFGTSRMLDAVERGTELIRAVDSSEAMLVIICLVDVVVAFSIFAARVEVTGVVGALATIDGELRAVTVVGRVTDVVIDGVVVVTSGVVA